MSFDRPRTSDRPTEVPADPRGRFLEELASACRDVGLVANVVAGSDMTPPVLVVERFALVKEIRVDRQLMAAEATSGVSWAYVWSWGEVIRACGDPQAAARQVAVVLGAAVKA